MFLQTHRRTVLLAVLAAGLGVVLFLVNRPADSIGLQVSAPSGLYPSSGKTPIVASQTVGLSSASVSQNPKVSSASSSVHQILPRLEQTVSDWRGYQPQKMTIAPYADLALEFEMTSVRVENGRTIWRGRNALSGAFLVTVATLNEWHAVLEVPAASSFEFHISGQIASVTESNATVLCGNEKLTASAAVSGAVEAVASVALTGSTLSSTDNVNTVDALFFYDAATLAANGNNIQRIETTIAGLVESANTVLQNSGVNSLRWRYVAAYQVPNYTATDSLQDDLNLISNSSNVVGKFVADKCALHGVDQAMLFVGNKRGDNYDGLGWVPSGEGAVAHSSTMLWNSGYVVLAHEFAHNFGCRHDRKTEGVTTDDGKYSYGFRFDLNGKDTGTVMSYASTRVPFFSNPNCTYAGVALGVQADGSDEANNSRVLREHAETMAAYRALNQAPIIIANPQSVRVSQGASVSLGVSATGSELTFQWKKNGIALSGATDSAYVKSSAEGSDEGLYSVVVANALGQVSSDTAAVAMADIASSSTSSSNASSSNNAAAGGGGGGAVEPWVLVAFAALCSLRFFAHARRDR